MPAVLTFAPIRGATEDEQQCYEALEFQPTCPVRGTTTWRMPHGSTRTYFNPRAPYGARRLCLSVRHQHPCISIHVPRTGHDARRRRLEAVRSYISIHAPLTGRDPYNVQMSATSMEFQSTRPLRGTTGLEMMIYSATVFQSTRPLRGTTAWHNSRYRQQVNFNPRAPYGARRCLPTEASIYSNISIHVPRTGHDGDAERPARAGRHISIHVPRTGHDIGKKWTESFLGTFQSTCPVRGTTVKVLKKSFPTCSFQSTCPVRGTTVKI